MLRVFGSSISYYTGKLEAFLRYRSIDYELLPMMPHAEQLLQGAGAVQAPTVQLDDGRWMADTTPMLAWLDAQAMVKPGPVGCVGHCMSGRYITTAAARYPHRIKAAASMYGVGIVTDAEDSPHLLLDKVKGELYYCFAEVDHTVPDHVIPALKDALSAAGTRHVLEQLPGTTHGFQFSERPAYAPEQAEHAWDQIFALWERNLR